MTGGNITQRLINSAEDANDDIAAKSFHHTVQSGADDALDKVASSSSAKLQKGTDIHDMLMARAEAKAHLESSLGQGSQFFDYKASSVGRIGGNKEIRRELSHKSREERRVREERFGHHKRRPGDRSKSSHTNDRQSYNATGSSDSKPADTGTRQEFNSQAPESRTTFREPPSRGYNPFA